MSWRPILVGLLFGAAPAAWAQAQPPPESPEQVDQSGSEVSEEERERDARALFAMASRHYDSGRLAESIEEFARAYALFPLPALQYNLYLAHRDAGHTADAAAALRLYLDTATDVEEERRASLTRRLELLEANAAVAGETETETRELETGPDEVLRDPHPPETSGGLSPAIGGIITGVGGALLVGALIEGLVANGKKSELDELCPGDPGAVSCPAAEQASIVSSFETNRNVAWGLLYAGAAVTVTGVVLLILSGGGDEDGLSASVSCTGDGCVGAVGGAF